MVGFTIKGREIGREAIDECLPLGHTAGLYLVEVTAKVGITLVSQPPRQAAVDHVVFAHMQVNARLLPDQAPDPIKIGLAERDIPHRLWPGMQQ